MRLNLRKAAVFAGDRLVDYDTIGKGSALFWLRLRVRLCGADVVIRPEDVTPTGRPIYRADDRRFGRSRYFTSMRVGVFYTSGLEARARAIGESYALEHVSIRNGDIVVDCGANYGDLRSYLELAAPDARFVYVAVEPGRDELECLRRNLAMMDGDNRVVDAALGAESCVMPFYYDPTPANSSLVEPATYVDKYDVRVRRLDELANTELPHGARIRLLKLEAEGAEPEVVAGGINTLSRIDYIAADLGFERGTAGETTAPAVVNILLTHGFELVAVGSAASMRLLFRNTQVPEWA